jgi:hypothetical protein
MDEVFVRIQGVQHYLWLLVLPGNSYHVISHAYRSGRPRDAGFHSTPPWLKGAF